MPRPKKLRHIKCNPNAYYFKPRGIPMRNLEEIVLEADELEAIRLADYENLFHEIAAERMNISRQTFGRIIKSARNKLAAGLLEGKAIKFNEIEFKSISEEK
ncbi:MAG: DUF134 domain-containing protein [Melioribacteraceae bacterium]|nr:DUF134 domain-containing protein [Melioribacteraceae bacterium]